MNRMRVFKKLHILLLLALLLIVWVLPMAVFASASPAQVTIDVEKQIAGDVPEKGETFSFILSPADSTNPMPAAGDSLRITGAGKGQFGPLVYEQPGEYIYTVREAEQNLSGYTFDTAVYQMNVKVFYDTGGSLRSQVTVRKEGAAAKGESIIFVNEYRGEENPEKTEKPETPTTPEAPKGPAGGSGDSPVTTGDENNLKLWLTVLLLSAAGLFTMAAYGHKKDEK